MIKGALYTLSLWVFVETLFAAELPQDAPLDHMGVATCASGVCHGSVNSRTTTPILQNEYVVWSRFDPHRNAYNTLLSEESQWIAKNLGYENAHEAAVCLDCHADNVPVENRGERFHLNDGIGCEACHGGAENYLMSHTDPDQTHEDNLAAGMYPTDRIADRAALCMSCHVGNENKIASHLIMGAGHPRISFELDTFGVLQPAHYVLDEDYGQRKESADHVTTWALGQIEYARQTLLLIETHLERPGRFPELSLFDCHACHHPMSEQHFEKQQRVNLPAGSVRLNDAGFVMLYAVVRTSAPAMETRLHSAVQALHQAAGGHAIKGDLSKAITTLRGVINDLEVPAKESAGNPAALLKNVVTLCQQGSVRDYAAAEQAVMAIELLLGTTGEKDKKAGWLDSLYKSLEDEDAFDTYRFRDLAKVYR